ncbi:uncharacterized protein LOC126394139 isoform X3 [Epinephelus moara]|uniref:uncharacterized protein LOC126394139 isoform X3 n=1 Tax=Epinephelus moara TaxID=300413 RepID=UPI00214E6719|nr:uncharacterized protein LOC126394139 isoform X3 [Epinephelus moara]
MPGMCSVPGCKGYKKARSRGVVFHSLPTRDPERCRKWLKAIQSPKFDENTPVSKYGNIRVCSQHFKPEDYEPDIQAELMKTTPRKILKSNVIPTVFSGRQQEDLCTYLPADDRSPAQVEVPSTAAQDSTSVVSGCSVNSMLRWASVSASGPITSSQTSSLGVQSTVVDTASPSPSLPILIASGAPSTSSQPPSPAELSESSCSVASAGRLNESFHKEAELSSTAPSQSGRSTEKDLSQSKTIVNDSCLMELFKKCQTCGQPITKKKVSHCGAQKKVRWSCLGGHRGIWMSSPHLREAFPEIHLLTTLSVLFSGATFTHFKKWAKHLHLNFMGHKTFFEIQKAYLNPEMKEMNRTEQEGIFVKDIHQQPEGTLPHISDPLKKIKAKSKRREKGALSSRSSYEMRSSTLMNSTGTSTQVPTALSRLVHLSASERGKRHQQEDVEHQSETRHLASEVDGLQDSFEEMEVTIDDDECNSVKNRLSDLDSDTETASETTELSASGADNSCDGDVYVPVMPQRTDLESDMENATETTELSAPGAANSCDGDVYVPVMCQSHKTSELKLECEEEELEPWQKHTLHVRLKEEHDVGELSDDQTDCKPDPSSLQSWAAGQHTVTPEACGAVHTSEGHQISSNPVSLSSVQSPEVYATSSDKLQSDQSNSQTLSVPFPPPCLTAIKLEPTET